MHFPYPHVAGQDLPPGLELPWLWTLAPPHRSPPPQLVQGGWGGGEAGPSMVQHFTELEGARGRGAAQSEAEGQAERVPSEDLEPLPQAVRRPSRSCLHAPRRGWEPCPALPGAGTLSLCTLPARKALLPLPAKGCLLLLPGLSELPASLRS